jgi:predicted lipoprotein with Yx(FWY)xxD motif
MKNTTLFLLMLVVISTLLIAGCTMPKSTLPASTAQPTPQTTQLPAPMPVTQLPDTIKKADTAFGAVLVNGQGKMLYYFTFDQYTNGASACDEVCARTWPVFFTDTIRVSSPLNPADFASITRADGTKQTTYNGIPLYFYSGDSKPGDINGSGINKVWYVANIAGTVPTTPPTPTPTAVRTPSLAGGGGGGGGGY